MKFNILKRRGRPGAAERPGRAIIEDTASATTVPSCLVYVVREVTRTKAPDRPCFSSMFSMTRTDVRTSPSYTGSWNVTLSPPAIRRGQSGSRAADSNLRDRLDAEKSARTDPTDDSRMRPDEMLSSMLAAADRVPVFHCEVHTIWT